MSTNDQSTKRRRNIAENFNRLSRAHERYRQTIGAIAYSEHDCEFMFAKNSRFEPPFEGLRLTHKVHLWLEGKRIVAFILVIIELFSLALMAVALLSEVCRNRRFPTGVSHFECKF